MIDRLEPTGRPDRPVNGYQKWRSLLFMHWPVPIEQLRPLLPRQMELDLFEGVAYVGVVPFSMLEVRPRWAPSWLGFNFLETNVRTYVIYKGRPGVYFFSLDAASRIAVMVARQVWSLPYHFAKMSLKSDSEVHHYRTVRAKSKARHEVLYRLGKELGPSEPGTIEFFFLERYLLFLEHQQKIFTGHVHHTPYPAQQAQILELHDDLLSSAGILASPGLPSYVHYSAGVDVEIFALQSED